MEKIEKEARAFSEAKRRKTLAKEIVQDFEKRREARRSAESGWLLNMKFLGGEQYCDVGPRGEIIDEDKRFYWQTRRVYNRIAPLIDARMSKLTNLRPSLSVAPFSDEEKDVQAAKLTGAVLQFVADAIELPQLISKATLWAETCGSAFYKVTWNEKGGRQVSVDENGAPVYEGEVRVSVVPSFELFPDRLDAESLEEVGSLIHAQRVPTAYVLEKFGVSVEKASGSDILAEGNTLDNDENSVLLIERYVKPSVQFPEGKLEIVAGETLLLEAPLPYFCGERNERSFPFVKQDCLRLPGAFFGQSLIHRLIPLQRAYNAVRNRKHEFLNRLSMGVLAVEDGSIDCDELAEEGLAPGKVIVYRQGAQPPKMLDISGMPAEFAAEEEWLEREFSFISGVSDLARSSTVTNVTSASGLQLMLSQDNSRLSATIDSMERAVQEVGRQILRLYRQFAGSARLMTITGENKRTQIYYFNASTLPTADIRFVSEVAATPSEKRETLLKLYEAGLLTDEGGKVDGANRHRILDAFGFGDTDNVKDISALHLGKAGDENVAFLKGEVAVDEFDDHALHIHEHTRYLLGTVFERGGREQVKERALKHLREHKLALKTQEEEKAAKSVGESSAAGNVNEHTAARNVKVEGSADENVGKNIHENAGEGTAVSE